MEWVWLGVTRGRGLTSQRLYIMYGMHCYEHLPKLGRSCTSMNAEEHIYEIYTRDNNSSRRLNRSIPSFHRSQPSSFSDSPASLRDFNDWKPHSTHRNKPPAVYCVKEQRCSPSCTGTLECRRMAEGMNINEPGENSITSPRSQTTRCPPFS